MMLHKFIGYPSAFLAGYLIGLASLILSIGGVPLTWQIISAAGGH